jgi:protein involved in polysaccharide export with SLBB domain
MNSNKALYSLNILICLILLNFSAVAQPDKKGNSTSPTSPWNINPYSKTPYKNANSAENKANGAAPQADPVKAKAEVLKAKKAANKNAIDKNNESVNEEFADENPDDLLNEVSTKGAVINSMSADQLGIYGMSFFAVKNNALTLSDNAMATPPASYKIGPGDEILVNIWGPSEEQLSYDVGKDGSIYPRYIGKINVAGLSFNSAKNLIINRFKSKIAAGSNVDVQLGAARSIKITVMGEIKQPGTITLSAFNTALNAIRYAGGPTVLANLREIEIKRNGYVVNTIDLYEFIKTGGSLDDIYLDDGDIVNVGISEKIVTAAGSFKRPMRYILKKDETLDDLINYAGGPSFDGRFSNITVKTIVNEQPRLITVNKNLYEKEGSTLLLYDGDEVIINKVNPNYANTIQIIGAVNYPDDYQVVDGERIMDVIRKAGGLVSDAFTARAYLYRGNTFDSEEAIKIDITNLKDEDGGNILILPGDKISIISKSEFQSNYSVEVVGSVRKPGSIKYIKNIKLRDLLILSGGLTNEAESGRIEIVSIADSVNNVSIDLKGAPLLTTVQINPDLEIDKISEEIVLKPFDKVYIRKKSDFTLLKKVLLKGEVKYPGEYPLLKANETISSLIERAGGLTKEAYLDGCLLYRSSLSENEKLGILKERKSLISGISKVDSSDVKSLERLNEGIDASTTNVNKVKIVFNLAEALAKPNSENDIAIKDLDEIEIPKLNETVTVIGLVQSPSTFKFTKNFITALDLIEASGGFAENANKKKVSVRYSNGVTRKVSNYYLFQLYPSVRPGCVVSVPAKAPKKDNSGVSMQVITVILGSASTFASLAIALKSLGII